MLSFSGVCDSNLYGLERSHQKRSPTEETWSKRKEDARRCLQKKKRGEKLNKLNGVGKRDIRRGESIIKLILK